MLITFLTNTLVLLPQDPRPRPEHVLPPNQALVRRIDACVAPHMQQDRIPGVSVAIVHHGKEALVKAYGVASAELHVPVTSSTVFAIASVSSSIP